MMSPDDWEKEYKIGWFWMSLNNWHHMFDETYEEPRDFEDMCDD